MNMKYTFLLVVLSIFFFMVKTADLDRSNIDGKDLKNQLPEDFSKNNITIDSVKKLLKDKCVKIAGDEGGLKALTEIEASTLALSECINDIVNFTEIQKEINVASPDGELDVVFTKYCLKKPEAIKCIEIPNSKLTPCLDKEEREHQEVFMRIIRSLLSFVCYKGGDQIALFIAEKGPECLEAHKEDIQNCINKTFSAYIPSEGIENIKTLPKFVMGPKQCDDMQHLENCIVKKLEACDEITPANIVESMFRFIKNETICRSIPNTNKQVSVNATDTASSMFIHLKLLLYGLFATYFNPKTIF